MYDIALQNAPIYLILFKIPKTQSWKLPKHESCYFFHLYAANA